METSILLYINLISGVTLLVLGLIVQTGKANFLIAGYNTASKEEQAKWNVKAMSKFTGWGLLAVPSIILLIACIPISLNFFPLTAMHTSWILFTVIIVSGAIYMNRSPRFKHTE